MDKNIKITLGCFGIITALTSSIVGRIIKEKEDRKNIENKFDKSKDNMSKRFEELRKRQHNKYNELRKNL